MNVYACKHLYLSKPALDHMKYKPGHGRLSASLKAMDSMLSRDGRRDVIKMAVVIGGGVTGGARRTSITGRRASVAHPSLGKQWRHPRLHFYRATRMHSADNAVARCLSARLYVCPSVCLSVRMSVTRRYSVETSKHNHQSFYRASAH